MMPDLAMVASAADSDSTSTKLPQEVIDITADKISTCVKRMVQGNRALLDQLIAFRPGEDNRSNDKSKDYRGVRVHRNICEERWRPSQSDTTSQEPETRKHID